MKLKITDGKGVEYIIDDAETVEVIADDERDLFNIRSALNDVDGSLEIYTGGGCVKHNGIMFDSGITIQPTARNVVVIGRIEYK